ncbi:MAG: hypothetical protein WAU86_14420 [Oricola sp.]
MKNLIATAALAVVLSSGAAAAASAMPAPAIGAAIALPVEAAHYDKKRFAPGAGFVLPKKVVIRSLYERGFTQIRDVRRVRGDYVAIAKGHRGPVRLLVDGRTARILDRQPLFWGWNQGPSKKPGHPPFGIY